MFFDERRSHFLKDRLQRRLKVCQLDFLRTIAAYKPRRPRRVSVALETLPSTRPVSFATGRNSICCRNRA